MGQIFKDLGGELWTLFLSIMVPARLGGVCGSDPAGDDAWAFANK